MSSSELWSEILYICLCHMLFLFRMIWQGLVEPVHIRVMVRNPAYLGDRSPSRAALTHSLIKPVSTSLASLLVYSVVNYQVMIFMSLVITLNKKDSKIKKAFSHQNG